MSCQSWLPPFEPVLKTPPFHQFPGIANMLIRRLGVPLTEGTESIAEGFRCSWKRQSHAETIGIRLGVQRVDFRYFGCRYFLGQALEWARLVELHPCRSCSRIVGSWISASRARRSTLLITSAALGSSSAKGRNSRPRCWE